MGSGRGSVPLLDRDPQGPARGWLGPRGVRPPPRRRRPPRWGRRPPGRRIEPPLRGRRLLGGSVSPPSARATGPPSATPWRFAWVSRWSREWRTPCAAGEGRGTRPGTTAACRAGRRRPGSRRCRRPAERHRPGACRASGARVWRWPARSHANSALAPSHRVKAVNCAVELPPLRRRRVTAPGALARLSSRCPSPAAPRRASRRRSPAPCRCPHAAPPARGPGRPRATRVVGGARPGSRSPPRW